MQNIHDMNLAMFRFNFWHKPFLSPPAAHQPFPAGMESSTFLPNPLNTPALMVLASTAENHEGARIPGQQRFPAQDKDGPQFTNPNLTMYRPGEHFPPPIYAPAHHFVGPAPDRNAAHSGVRIMNPVGSSAFRPVSTDSAETFHSAFSPTKRQMPEDLSHKSSFNSSSDSLETRDNNESRDLSMKEDRPASLNSQSYETNSDSHSDADQGTPDSEGRSLRKQRKKLILDGQTPYCPVCGLTLRPGEADTHLQQELEKLERLSSNLFYYGCQNRKILDGQTPYCPVCGLTIRPGEAETHLQQELEKLERLSSKYCRKSRETTPQGRKCLPSPSCRKGKESPGMDTGTQARFETYLRIQCNRQARLNARTRSRKKKQEETICPVCNRKVTGTSEELNEHVELCLKKRHDEEEPVDIEGEQYEEYTWAGQTRIRASSMLDGGFAGSGFQVASTSRHNQDEDVDLNVDDDDSAQYGKPQYSEADIIPCASDEPSEDKEREALRGAVLSCNPPYTSTPNRIEPEGAHHPEENSDWIKTETMETCDDVGGSAGQIITALRCKLKDKQEHRSLYKCLICMEPFNVPVTSIQCWHVHCEDCWLRTLGAKKLCPQCNMITSPADLRRIYL